MIQKNYDEYGNEKEICNHWECPYKYCMFHEDYEERFEIIVNVPSDSEVADECKMYLDV